MLIHAASFSQMKEVTHIVQTAVPIGPFIRFPLLKPPDLGNFRKQVFAPPKTLFLYTRRISRQLL